MAFNGEVEHCSPPDRMNGHEVLEKGEERRNFLFGGGRALSESDPVHRTGVKRMSRLFDLPYWQVSGKIGNRFGSSSDLVPTIVFQSFNANMLEGGTNLY